MAVLELASDGVQTIEGITFAQAGLREREDLQRLLRKKSEAMTTAVEQFIDGIRQFYDAQKAVNG